MKKKIFFLLIILLLLTAAMTACSLFGVKIGKIELTEEMVRCTYLDSTYVYTGNAITFDEDDFHVWVDGEIVDIDLFDIEYKDNVEAGTASVTITAKPENDVVKGSVTLHFTIVENGSIDCREPDDLASLLISPSVNGVMMWCDYTIPEGSTLTVPAGKTLNMIYGYHFYNDGTLVNDGSVILRGALLSTGGRRASELINRGKIENHGTLEIKDYGVLDDSGSFTSDGTVLNNGGTIYLLDEDKAFITDGEGASRYVRLPITADLFTVEECEVEQGLPYYTPRVTMATYGTDFTVEYANNEHAGAATATVTVSERDLNYYGRTTVPFTIKRGAASVTTLESLKECVASGDYDRYSISALTLPAGDSFTLPAGQTLSVMTETTVGGELSALGDLSCNNLTVSEGAVFVNGGSLSVSGYKFVVNGTFRNAATGDWNFGARSVELSGRFVNQGSAENKSFTIRGGSLRNEGTLTLSFNSYNYGGVFENVGTAAYLGASNYSPALRNEQGGVVNLAGDVRFGNEFTNQGRVVNGGRVLVQENCAYACTGTFDNSAGDVWGYPESLAGITERYHRKRYLTDEDVLFEAAYSETPYNAADQKPSFTVDGAPLQKGEYSQTFYYVSLGKYVTECIKTGEVKMRVSITTDYSSYAGYIDYTYAILPTTIRVTDSSAFYTAARDDGYDKIVLDADIALWSNSGVNAGCVLDLNGHRIKINQGAYFSLIGTMTGGAAVDPDDFTPTEEGAALIVEQNGYFSNYGTLVNDGFIYVKSGGTFTPNARLSTGDSAGTVVNNGVIYSPSDVTVESGEGKVFWRRSMREVKNLIRVPTVPYDGTPKTPAPTMVYHDADVDIDRFSLRYDLNVEAGTALLRLDVVDPFDQDFYGTVSVFFTIERGTARVSTREALAAAASDANYATIVLGANITLNAAVTLSDDQTLALGAYELSFSSNGGLTFGKNCRLTLTADNEARFIKYFYGADEITLTGDIGAVGEQTALNFKGYTLAGFSGVNYLSTTVHMEGFSFVGGLDIVNSSIENFACLFENSAETLSAIGSSVTSNTNGYALTYGTCYEETYVTLRNLTVYGVYHHGGSGTAQVVDLSAENCTFLADRDRQTAYAFRVWTSMTASGTYTNCTFDGANAYYVNRGYKYDHDAGKTLPAYFFYDCTLNAYGTPDKTEYYGNALTMDRNKSNLSVEIKRSHLYSQSGNCIRVTNRTGVYLDVDNLTTFEHAEGKANVLG